jgi:hypothetical protein
MLNIASSRLLEIIDSNELSDGLTDAEILASFDLSLCYELFDLIESEDLITDGYDIDFCQFLIALSSNCNEVLPALRYLQLAAESLGFVYGDDSTLPYFQELSKVIIERLKQGDNLTIDEKISIFKDMTDDDLHWARPLCAVAIAINWEIPSSSMDECLESYFDFRDETEEGWSDDLDEYDYANWLPLVAIAALKSTGSARILEIVDLTSKTSSALPLWAWFAIFEKHASSGGTKGLKLEEWFPEKFWKELLFLRADTKIEIDKNNWFGLLAMYFEREQTWLWSYDWVNLDKDELDAYFGGLL